VSVAGLTFPETDQFTWNVFAPRLGLVFDLSGDGKTVVKGNYGFFWHNPGVTLGSNANPNTTAKSATYTWNDINGDRRWQNGEQVGNPTSQSLQGTIGLDPNIKAPYSHEASFFLERQVGEMIGVRTGFVYKTEHDLTATYEPGRSILNGAFSAPFPFVDIGEDGVRGTGDDRTITLLGMPAADAARFPTNRVVMNVPRDHKYKTAELSMTKRYSNKWSAAVGFGYTWSNDYPETAAPVFPINPNQPGLADRTGWGLKASGSYDAPWGIRLSPVLRHQSGINFARVISVPATAATAFGLILPTSTVYAEPADARREDNIWVFDVRAEKNVNITSRVRTRLFLDLFNITNSHASEAITRTTGANFLRPANILAPRTARLGFRFLW
jgi:hypothetical protein